MLTTLQLLERQLDDIEATDVAWFDVPLPCPWIKPGEPVTNLNWCPDNHADPEHDRFETADLNILHYPKAKDRLSWWIERIVSRMAPGQRLWIVGDNHSGIKSLPKRLKDNYEVTKLDAARHCLLFEVSATRAITPEEQWTAYDWDGLHCFALPGVFSAGRLDKGTQVLMNVLPEFRGNIMEFGSGCGVITAALARQPGVNRVDAIEIDLLAVRSSRKTLRANQLESKAQTHWSAGTRCLEPQKYDAIVTNPPFHQGVRTAYVPTEQFFNEAHHWLKPGGQLIWVVNDFLYYEGQLDRCFSRPKELSRERGFKVLMATRSHR